MLGKSVMNLDGRTVKFFLAKPLTYMNDSGNAVASISAYYQIEPDHIVVIHDDMDLEFGRIKVKAGGSAGGHNGIKSIDRSLGTPKYARVRMGVGHSKRGANAHDNTVNWVLGGFGPDQRKQLPEFWLTAPTPPRTSSSTVLPRPRRSSMAGEATHPDLINGSLVGILSELEQDKTFLKLAAGDIEASDDVDNSVLAGIPEGLRPALAAAIGQGVAGKPGKPVVLVVASGREAEETVGSLRSWYDGDPNDIAQLEAWETLPHEASEPARGHRGQPHGRVPQTQASERYRFDVRPDSHSRHADPLAHPASRPRTGRCRAARVHRGGGPPLDEAAKRLIENAYTRVDLVMDRGEFAVRGGILDVFPPTAPHPCVSNSSATKLTPSRNSHASDQRTYGDGLKTIWATACRELQLTDAVRTRAKALVGSIPNAEDMLESIANASGRRHGP